MLLLKKYDSQPPTSHSKSLFQFSFRSESCLHLADALIPTAGIAYEVYISSVHALPRNRTNDRSIAGASTV